MLTATRKPHSCALSILAGAIWWALTLSIPFPLISQAVSAAPNEGILTGTVLEDSTVSSTSLGMSPEQTLFRLLIRIEAVEDVDSLPNFLREKVGRDLAVYSQKSLLAGLSGRKVRASVSFEGDERGGVFYLNWLSTIQ